MYHERDLRRTNRPNDAEMVKNTGGSVFTKTTNVLPDES